MKNKILKKLMIFGLVCSMSLTMMPTSVMAAGTQTESETRHSENTQGETKQTQETQTEKPQAEKKAMLKMQSETETLATEKASESGTKASETPQSETKSAETEKKDAPADTEQTDSPGAVEELLDQPGRTTKAAEAGELLIEGGEEGKDYTYDKDNKSYTIISDTPLTISGESGWEYEDKIVVDVGDTNAKQARITLSGVVLKRGSDAVLEVKKGSRLELTLEWENRFAVEGNNAPAVVLEADTELAIGGDKLVIEVPKDSLANNITMSRGDKTEDKTTEAASCLKITSGTVIAQKGISVRGNASNQRVSVQISGGSVDLKTPARSVASVTNDKRVNVYKKIIQLAKDDVKVEDLSVMHNGKEYTYGCQGIYKNADKEIFLYLPEGKATVTAEQSEYSGNVTQDDDKTENKIELTKTKAELSVGEAGKVTLPELEYGYTSADLVEVPVTIKNAAANKTNVTVEFATGQSKNFELTQKSAVVPAKTSAGAGVNQEIKIRLKTTGLDAGTYTDKLKLTGEDGSIAEADVTFTVKKAKIMLTSKNVKIDSKVYDGKKAATGTVSLPEINGKTPEIDTNKVVFKFNSANVKDATSVTVSNLKLTDTWENNYELASTELEVPAKNKIKKAPNKHTKDDLKVPNVTATYVKAKGVWQPQLTTYKGQEYLFFGSSYTELTTKNKKSEKWRFGDKNTVKDRLVSIEEGLKSGATYTVWTRFAGDDNHEPSDGEVTAYATFTVGQNGGGTDANGNKINGLTEGTTYKTGSRLAFGAVGAGMSNTSPKAGDERFLPVSWKVSEEHTWSSSPYEAAFTINQAGSYTLQVTFRKQTYTNGAWTNTSTTSVSKVNFKMASTGTNGTGYNTSSSTTTSSSSGTGSSTSSAGKTTSTAAKTGDQSPILPLAVIFLASAAVLAGYLWKKKSKVKE